MSNEVVIISTGEELHLSATTGGELCIRGETSALTSLHVKCGEPLGVWVHDDHDWVFEADSTWSSYSTVSGAVHAVLAHTNGDQFHDDVVVLQMQNNTNQSTNKVKTLPIKIKPVGDGPDLLP